MPNESSSSLIERTPLIERTGSSFIKSCFNGTNAFLGIGLITVPYAIARAGWLSLTLFFIVALMTFYTGLLLKRCLEEDSSVQSYLDIAEKAFGKTGRIVVMIILNAELYLVCIGLLIMEADNLNKLFPNFMIQLGSLSIDGIRTFVMITCLIVLPTMLLTDLGVLSYVSATGVFSCLVIFVSILCVGAFSGVGFRSKGKLWDTSGLGTALSLYIVCFAGHPVVPSIYTSMRHPNQFRQVLSVSFILTTITYALMAIVSYLMYGDEVQSQITLNLPSSSVASQVAIYTTLLIPITRYALMMTPVADLIESGLPEDLKNKTSIRRLIRLALLFSTTILACLFPHFESLISIVGSIFVVFGSLLLPCFCYMKISRCYQCWSKLIGIVSIVVFGIVAGVLGTYSSIYDLVEDI